MVETLQSRIWGFDGPIERQFEMAFSDFVGTRYGLCLANGTVTLEVALKACGIGPGDEVVVPAATFLATAVAVVNVGARPVFADIDSNTLCMDPVSAAKAVTDKTRAIIPVHLYGTMAHMDEIMQLAESYNLFVIEDAAHAHGSRWKDEGPGSVGHAASFSFQMAKIMTAGEGGFIATNDERFMETCYALKNCGRRSRNYEPSGILGFNYRMTEFQCAVLLGQLRRLPQQHEKREANAKMLDENLRQLEGIKPLTTYPEQSSHSRYRYGFQFDQEVYPRLTAKSMTAALEAEGFLMHSVFTPVYRDPLYSVSTIIDRPEAWLANTEAATRCTILFDHRVLLYKDVVDRIPEAIESLKGNI